MKRLTMKRILNDLARWTRRRYGSKRGSALLVSLMVMVGLSLLGLSFVAVSETESAISAHERDGAQTLDVAEAGAKMVVEWFQDPVWANANGFLPPNNSAIKTQRTVSGASPSVSYYKGGDPTTFLFDKPFKDTVYDRFWGDETHPDVLIDYTNSTGQTFLNTLNQLDRKS